MPVKDFGRKNEPSSTVRCRQKQSAGKFSTQTVKKYIRRILDDMSAEQVHDCLVREQSYRDKIKAKIKTLATAHAEEVFFQWLDADKIHIADSFRLAETISPVEKGQAIPVSLYDSEAKMNSLEARV